MKKKIKIISFIFIILTTFILFYLYNKQKKLYNFTCEQCNVIFISFDALRADRVDGKYFRDVTPNIKSLFSNSLIITNAISSSSWTLPATMSWFTGVYPSRHKIVNKFTLDINGNQEISNLNYLSPNLITMAEIFKNNGYLTAAFTGGAALSSKFGFNKGFDKYIEEEDFSGFENTYPKAIEYIKSNKDKKLFIFLHGYNAHGQYKSSDKLNKKYIPKTYHGKLSGSVQEHVEMRENSLKSDKLLLTKEDVDYLLAIYDEKVEIGDYELGKFFKEYQKLKLMDKTIIVITSDHGEELYDHGRIDHGHSLYDELIHVPLVIYLPRISKTIINKQVRSIDLFLTIFAITKNRLSKEANNQIQGINLINYILNNQREIDAFSETDYRYVVSKKSIRTNTGYKYIKDYLNNLDEVYDLKQDNKEVKNLFENNYLHNHQLIEALNKFTFYE